MELWYSLLDLTISRYVTLNISAVIAVHSETDEVHHMIHKVYTDFYCIIVFQKRDESYAEIRMLWYLVSNSVESFINS